MIFYPGGYSETEILLAYGGVRFASKLGQLAGNHFLTVEKVWRSCRRSDNAHYGKARRTSSSNVFREQ